MPCSLQFFLRLSLIYLHVPNPAFLSAYIFASLHLSPSLTLYPFLAACPVPWLPLWYHAPYIHPPCHYAPENASHSGIKFHILPPFLNPFVLYAPRPASLHATTLRIPSLPPHLLTPRPASLLPYQASTTYALVSINAAWWQPGMFYVPWSSSAGAPDGGGGAAAATPRGRWWWWYFLPCVYSRWIMQPTGPNR